MLLLRKVEESKTRLPSTGVLYNIIKKGPCTAHIQNGGPILPHIFTRTTLCISPSSSSMSKNVYLIDFNTKMFPQTLIDLCLHFCIGHYY